MVNLGGSPLCRFQSGPRFHRPAKVEEKMKDKYQTDLAYLRRDLRTDRRRHRRASAIDWWTVILALGAIALALALASRGLI